MKFGIAFVPNNFNYDLLDNTQLSFRDLKVVLIAGPFDTLKEASESMESFYSNEYKFGHEKLVINYNPKTMCEIEF
jgi:hypothetical protein